MAQFYGRLQGARGEATRLGHKTSGLRTTAETWTRKVCVDVFEDSHGNESARVVITTKTGQLLRVLFDGPLEPVYLESVQA